jgi:hypothetical protein
MCTPPAGISKSSGSTMRTRSASTTTDDDDSTISWIVFMPVHTPENRLMASACNPMSRISCTLEGKNTGRPQALKMWSLWCAAVELLLTWSSPATAMTPPCFDVPAMLACLNTSEQRSTPGPLPYQMPNTPSWRACCGYSASLLGTPHRGGGQLLVHPGLEDHVVLGQVLLAPATAPGRSRPAGCRGNR